MRSTSGDASRVCACACCSGVGAVWYSTPQCMLTTTNWAPACLARAAPSLRPSAPVELTIVSTGDLLIHMPIARQAQVYAGGHGYDFRPMLAPVATIVNSTGAEGRNE